jgi:hypothetical protein
LPFCCGATKLTPTPDVFKDMTPPIDLFGRTDEYGGYVVRRPRETDAIGSTLRAVFVEDTPLPDDMQRTIDAITRRDCN